MFDHMTSQHYEVALRTTKCPVRMLNRHPESSTTTLSVALQFRMQKDFEMQLRFSLYLAY